jgi:hypothetical protein
MRRCVFLALVALFAGACWPARATASPQNVTLRVHDASKCDEDSCENGSAVREAATFAGTLKLFVHAEDPTGLRRVRVEAHPEGAQKWYCVAEEDVRDAGPIVDAVFEWTTTTWPAPESGSGCTHTLPHIHGKPTPNARIEIRAAAVNFVEDQDHAESRAFDLSLANPPAAPLWASDPAVASGTRQVALAWMPGPEPDLVAYRIDRRNPDGTVTTRDIDARAPERDGCSRFGDSTIRCSDTLPGSGGRYEYVIRALRPGGDERCEARARCLAGPPSEPRSVEVTADGGPSPAPDLTLVPVPSDFPGPSGSASPGATPTSSTDSSLTAAPSSDPGEGSPFGIVALALALIAAVATFLVVRARRGRPRPADDA